MKLVQEVKQVVTQVLDEKEALGGLANVVWVAAGGSNGGNYPAQYFMEHEATALTSHAYTSNEFVRITPKFVGKNTLAVVVSMRGTAETIEAARVAKQLGAATIAVYVDESELTEVCDYKIRYDSLAVDESDMARTNSAVVLALALELVHQTEGYEHYDDAMGNVMGSGPAFGAAYVFSICNVQEMLQIDSVTTNCCEFFHGPFEVLDKRTSVFLLVSVGRSRANDERAISFLDTYGGRRVYLLDAKEIGLNDLPDTVSEYFNHLIFSPILNNVYMRALSAVTHKDYMTRRYMWKVQY